MAITIISIIFLQGIIFVGLVMMLKHFMKGNVKGELGHLEKLNTDMLRKESELKQKIQIVEQEYSAKMAKLEVEPNQRQAQAKQEATKILEESKELALKERERIIKEAIETRDKIKHEIMAEMENTAIQYSTMILSEFFSGTYKKALQDLLLDQMLEGIESLQAETFQITSNTANLKVAEPLAAESKKKIQEFLKKKIGKDIEFIEEINPDLVGGIVLQFGNFVIDGSMNNFLKEAASRLKKEAHRKYQSVI